MPRSWRRAFDGLQDRHFAFAQSEAAGWPDETWAPWDRERRGLAARFPELTRDEAGYAAWARLRLGVSLDCPLLAPIPTGKNAGMAA